ncbi:MAG: hypothetical protein PWQ51_1338 [Methanolobus sp.]|nr:hypothetical protein [Methanolobus sp.]MDK2830466.1 hypothetical protein [Methanolobus sp.]MDK2939174.1 hypothetical protein [Methanolobus sp.]
MTTKECTGFDEGVKKIRIGTFSHSSNVHEIAGMINQKVFQPSLCDCSC